MSKREIIKNSEFLDLREWLLIHYPKILKKYETAESQGGMIVE